MHGTGCSGTCDGATDPAWLARRFVARLLRCHPRAGETGEAKASVLWLWVQAVMALRAMLMVAVVVAVVMVMVVVVGAGLHRHLHVPSTLCHHTCHNETGEQQLLHRGGPLGGGACRPLHGLARTPPQRFLDPCGPSGRRSRSTTEAATRRRWSKVASPLPWLPHQLQLQLPRQLLPLLLRLFLPLLQLSMRCQVWWAARRLLRHQRPCAVVCSRAVGDGP